MSDTPAPSKSQADGKILQQVSAAIGTIIFNNPDKRNAMSIEMWEGLATALTELRNDAAVRVVVLRGAGGKAFVSGADISQFEKHRHNAEASAEYSRRSGLAGQMLGQFPKPTIACIEGFCIGGGMQLAMQTDIRIAAEGSQFGIPAAKLGIAYGYQGLANLVSLVGPSWARLLMFTGMRIDSTEALRIGLVERVVSAEQLASAVDDIAQTIASNAPLAIAAAKHSIAQVLKDPHDRDMEAVKQLGIQCADSEDFREGRRAFMEKRTPRFTGR